MEQIKRISFAFTLVFLQLFIIAAQADGKVADPSGAVLGSPQDKALQQVRDELENVERRWYLLSRLRWGYPQRFSAGFGAMLTQQPKNTNCATGCTISGWHFEVEPGKYGIQGGVGWGRLVGETGRTKRWMHTVNWGGALRGVVLRTWGDGPLGSDAQTLAGIEGSLAIVRFNFSVGVMHTLTSGSDESWIVTGAFGWGF